MKISPDREQLTLVIIMNGLIIFIITILSLEMLLVPDAKVVESEPAVTEPVKERERVRPKVEESIEVSATQVKLPRMDSLETATEVIDKEEVSKNVAVAVEQPLDALKVKPPKPSPDSVALSARPGTKPVEEASDKAEAGEGGYTVQLGAFSSEEKATALVAKLGALKIGSKPLPVIQQTIKSGKKVMYRVRLGPFSSSAQAKQAASIASRQAAVDGTVLSPGQ